MDCKNCKNKPGPKMTWAEKKAQYGRLKKRGYNDEQIMEALPRHSKCLTKWMKNNPAKF